MVEISVFKAYDIRGLYPQQINEELAYKVGRALVSFLGCSNVAVCIDMRNSSESLKENLIRGITDQGADVIDIGMLPTPLLSFSVSHYGYDAGVVVSASHNPGQYNAFKLIRNPVLQIGKGSGMEEIKELVLKDNFKRPDSSVSRDAPDSKAKVSTKNPMPDYINHVMEFAQKIKGLKVVCDYGNGMGAVSAKPLLDKLDIDAVHMYPEPDGSFPNHPANPHDVKNMDDLRKKVIEEKADLGIFFDGDADRSLIIDDNGEILFPDLYIALLAEPELSRSPGEKIYFDLRFSRIVPDIIKKNGGMPQIMKVGNPFYKEVLVNEGGILAGEFSGHIMFKDNYNIDDGLFAAVKLMSFLSGSGKKLSELVEPLKVYCNTPEINIEIGSAEKGDDILKAVEDAFRQEDKQREILHIDGVSVQGEDWWFNLRKSNTEPLVRLRAEADDCDKLEEVKMRVMKVIEANK
ncbi:phosphomannomutase/phosphoglucomutase [Candidatus Woesearchaeota archaeon]|nr:phosphomannomutase/phosphoglucomutase [Candidatus Woesearchaeota archaeon]